MQHRPEAVDPQRHEAARQAVRAVAAGINSVRLYSPGHALVQKAIDQAVTVLKSYVDRYGALTLVMTPKGVAVESSAHPVDDDVVAEFVRALRSGFVRTVRILGGISARELSEFLHILHLPQPQIRQGGGVSMLLRARGVDSLVVEDFGEPVAQAGAAGVTSMLDAVAAGPDAVAAQLQVASGGEPEAAVHLLRELDRQISVRPLRDQQPARRTVAQALLDPTRFLTAVQAAAVRALDEPFAISLAAEWPLVMVEDLARGAGEDPGGVRARVLDTLRQPHRHAPGRIPVDAVARQEIQQARAALVATEPILRAHALRRLVEVLPALDAPRFEACIHVMERQLAAAGPIEAQVRVLAALGLLARKLTDGRADLARAALHRILTTQVRDRLALALGRTTEPGHPLDLLAREAPDEAALLLLELVAEESRLHVRREIVTQLQALAADRTQMLAEHLVDPRWHIARNVVTVLGSTARPDVVPYLRAALAHADVRVRKEALQALAQIRTPDAVRLLAQTLRHPDPQTQEAAAHWLGMTDSAEAVEALVALLRASPLHEGAEVKRAAIRALGRLGTAEAEAQLARIQSAGGIFHRRQINDLKAEAANALAGLRQARP